MPFFTLLLVVVLGGQLIAGIIVRNGIETNLRLNTIHTFLPLSLLNSHLNGTLILAQTILEWRYMEIIRHVDRRLMMGQCPPIEITSWPL